MSDTKETIYYAELRFGDPVQDGDQFRDVDGQWKPYTFLAHMGGKVGLTVKARRPIRTTHQTTYEEVPGSRTLQQAVDQPQRERIAYEELQPGDIIQEGDEWQTESGRWKPLVLTLGASAQVRHTQRARRPYKISTILEIGDALANAQKAATQLQDERDEALAALKSAQRARDELQLQVDELRADRERLQGLIDNLLDEPTAKRVYKMLEDMLDQTEWVGQCLDSTTYEQMSCIQRTISVIAERVNDMGKEADGADT